jgi:hypothetical protein
LAINASSDSHGEVGWDSLAGGESRLLSVLGRLSETLAADEAGDETESEEFFDVHEYYFLN